MNFSLFLETAIWNWNPSTPLALTELLALYLHSYHQFLPLYHPLWALPLTNPKIKSNLQVTQCLFPQLSTLFLTNLTLFHRVTLNLKTNRDNLLHQDETFNHSSYTPDTSDPNHKLIPRHFIDNISYKREYLASQTRAIKRPTFNRRHHYELKSEFSLWKILHWDRSRQEFTLKNASLPSQQIIVPSKAITAKQN